MYIFPAYTNQVTTILTENVKKKEELFKEACILS